MKKNKFKKTIVLFISILLVLALAGCAGIVKTEDVADTNGDITSDRGDSAVDLGTICPPVDYAPGVFVNSPEEVKEIMVDPDLSKYEHYGDKVKEIYQSMFESFYGVGYFYQVKTSEEGKESDITFRLNTKEENDFIISPCTEYVDAGIHSYILYRGNVYHVEIQLLDKSYTEDGQTISEYIYSRREWKTEGETVIKDNAVYYADYNNCRGGLSYIDSNYYYFIRPDLEKITVEELNELLSLIEFERVEIGSIDYADYNIEAYTVGILGHSDSFPASVDYGIITELYSENAFKHISPASERVVIIGQNEIRGGYVKTYNRFPSYYPLYKYSSDDGKYGFSVDEKGRVSSYINYEIIEDTDEILSDNEYITIAKNFVKGVYGRVPDWELFEVSIEKDKEIKGYYSISFEKYLYGMKTSENIYVQVAYSGEISMYSADMFGRIPANIDISVFEPQTVKAAVYKRLDDIYSGMSKETRDKYRTRYYLPEPVLSVLADGTPCYIYDVNVKFISVDNQKGYTDIVQVIVTPTE